MKVAFTVDNIGRQCNNPEGNVPQISISGKRTDNNKSTTRKTEIPLQKAITVVDFGDFQGTDDAVFHFVPISISFLYFIE